MSDRIAIMYGGEIMEQASAIDLFENPHHPYTLGLKNAFPSITTLGTELISIPGSPPTLVGPVQSCPFEPRCPFSDGDCLAANPDAVEIAEGHLVRCAHRANAARFRDLAKEKSTWLS